MHSPVIDREQAALQARLLGVDSAGLCDDVENSIGDILCDGLDELEAVLGDEPTVALDGDQIRQVGVVFVTSLVPSLKRPARPDRLAHPDGRFAPCDAERDQINWKILEHGKNI